MSQFIIIVISVMLYCTKSLHLKSHYEVSNALSTLNKIEESLMIRIKKLSQNKQLVNNKIQQTSNIEQKISTLETYLQQQRIQLLSIIKQSNIDLNSTHYVCPLIIESDRQILSNFNENINAQFSDLSKTKVKLNSEKDQNVIATQLNNLLPNFVSNNLPIYAKSSQNSVKSFYKTNINSEFIVLESNKLDYILPTQENIEICSFSIPFANSNNQCTKCPSQKPYLLLNSSQCTDCQIYDESTRSCLHGELLFTNFEAGKAQILLSDSENIDDYQINKQNLQLCPVQTPFFNGNNCIACSNRLYFSLKDKNCQTCPSGKFYNPYKQKCEIQLYFSNLNNLQWETNDKQVDDILESITIKRSNESYTSCPLDLPFSLEDKCIKCETGKHFSYDSLSCSKCSSDTQLDSNMHKCLKPGNLNFQTNPLQTSNLIYNGRSKNEWMNIYYQNLQKYSGIADCPLDLPNFDGLACISCPHSHPYFNLELMVCQTCEGTTLYDQSQRQCVNDDDNRPIQTPSWQKMAAVVFAK